MFMFSGSEKSTFPKIILLSVMKRILVLIAVLSVSYVATAVSINKNNVNDKIKKVMKFELPTLPYATDALAPVIGKETVELHYGKHYQTYLTNLNNLVVGTKFENADLETFV